MKLDELKNRGKKIVLFGAVENEGLRAFIEKGFHIAKFIDNDPRKIGKRIKEIRVEQVESLKNDDLDELVVVITTNRHIEEMENQIRSYGVTDYYVAVRDIDEFKNPEDIASFSGIKTDNPMPTILNLELSGVCNLRCIYCPFHGFLNLKKDKGLMTWGILNKILDQLSMFETFETLSVVGAGELFLHPEWYEMTCCIIERLGVSKLIIYTNGMLLNKENVYKIKKIKNVNIELEVSIDGENPSECDLYRVGSSYDNIRENVKFAEKELCGEGTVRITIFNLCLADDQSLKDDGYIIDQNNDPPSFLKEDFPNLHIVSRKPNLDFGIKGIIPGFKKVKIQKKPPYPYCWNTFNRMAINYRGGLLRCSCGRAGIKEIANVMEDDILQIWKTDVMMEKAREHILSGSFETDFCTGCELKGKDPYYVLIKDA